MEGSGRRFREAQGGAILPRVARNATLWVPEGKLNMRNARFLDDPRPVQDGCPCRLCRSFSRAYLAHLDVAMESQPAEA